MGPPGSNKGLRNMEKKREKSGFPRKEGGHVWARGRLSCCDSPRGPSGHLELPQHVALQEGAGGDVSWHPFVNGVPPKGKRRLCPLPHGEVHKRARIPLPPPPGSECPPLSCWDFTVGAWGGGLWLPPVGGGGHGHHTFSPRRVQSRRGAGPLTRPPSRRKEPYGHLDSGSLASRAAREYISVLPTPPVCGQVLTAAPRNAGWCPSKSCSKLACQAWVHPTGRPSHLFFSRTKSYQKTGPLSLGWYRSPGSNCGTLVPTDRAGDIRRGFLSPSRNEDTLFPFFPYKIPRCSETSQGLPPLPPCAFQGRLHKVDTYLKSCMYKKYWTSSGAARPFAQVQFMKFTL